MALILSPRKLTELQATVAELRDRLPRAQPRTEHVQNVETAFVEIDSEISAGLYSGTRYRRDPDGAWESLDEVRVRAADDGVLEIGTKYLCRRTGTASDLSEYTAQAAGTGKVFHAYGNSSGTVTIDCSLYDTVTATATGSVTFALDNDTDGSQLCVVVIQGSGGSHAVTWWSGVVWHEDAAPDPPTVEGSYALYTFLRVASGVWLGQLSYYADGV